MIRWVPGSPAEGSASALVLFRLVMGVRLVDILMGRKIHSARGTDRPHHHFLLHPHLFFINRIASHRISVLVGRGDLQGWRPHVCCYFGRCSVCVNNKTTPSPPTPLARTLYSPQRSPGGLFITHTHTHWAQTISLFQFTLPSSFLPPCPHPHTLTSPRAPC